MRVLLSTIGSRGDVQPLVALGWQLKALGQDVHLCVPPDFREWIEGLGMSITPIGPELRSTGKASPAAPPPTPEQRRQMIEGTVAAQFETITAAAQGCDIIVGATALQIAAPSIAEKLGIPYFFAAYCPAVLPSPHHAPPVLGLLGDKPAPVMADYGELWAKDAERWNVMWSSPLNARRKKLGLTPVDNVLRHILTNQPWLATDPVVAPWPDPDDQTVFQTGAWILPDERPLSPEVDAFLAAGEPPIFFGFGSNRAPENSSQVMVEAARVLGRRVIISRGWSDLSGVGDDPNCLVIGEANLQALFKRVSVVAHHGGAGTTTLSALAGVPQIIIPQMYDQHYFAQRVQQLGSGIAHAPGAPTTDSLINALERAVQPEVAARAGSLAATVRRDGAQIAAQHLITTVARKRR